MPELPEIETICRGITPLIQNQPIVDVLVLQKRLRWPIPKNLAAKLRQQKILAVQRRGKYLLLTTQTGTLIIHLGMSGQLQIKAKEHKRAKHEHCNIIFANNTALCYVDPRRFGAILWTEKDPLQHSLLKNLGPEPLEAVFNGEYLFHKAKHRKINVKQFIMDSKMVVGVGNIYANEALFLARINPLQKVNLITLDVFNTLVKQIKKVLQNAIKHGGTTIKDYVDNRGNKGGFQKLLKVYGRVNQPCVNCQTLIVHVRIGQRSTYYCGKCQK